MRKLGIVAIATLLMLVAATLTFAAPVSAASDNSTRASIDQTKASLQASVQEQKNQIYIEIGTQRLDNYNKVLSAENGQIANMSAKGYDVSGLQAVVSDAQANVVTPLQNAVDTGNGTVIKAQLKAACLDNGMPYSDHYAAKINLARLTAVDNKLLAMVNNTTIQGQLSDVNAKLTNVQGQLNTIGTNPYTGSQKDDVWNGLKAAAQELKTAISEINANHHHG